MTSSPQATTSLLSRASPLAPPRTQIALLAELGLEREFHEFLACLGWADFWPAQVEVFQINVGRLCNMTCRHCHVDAGPDRVEENMDAATAEACLTALDRTTARTVDLTGGAPEINPHFRHLVDEAVRRGKHVIDRSNLTILLVPKYADLPEWLGERGVEIVASLPHHRARNTDAQRGEGAFDRSIEALRRLNQAGYGRGDPRRRLTLMHNPAGAWLPGPQAGLETEFRRSLERAAGVTFDRLIALNNMPIARFLEWLVDTGNLAPYMTRLVESFNPGAVGGLMCRNTLSIGWDGTLYDCDFNQMLDLPIRTPDGRPAHVLDVGADFLARRPIVTGRHCFGCTAGAGSSCGGSTT